MVKRLKAITQLKLSVQKDIDHYFQSAIPAKTNTNMDEMLMLYGHL